MAKHVKIGLDPTSEIKGQPALYGAKEALKEDKDIEIVVPGDIREISDFCERYDVKRLYEYSAKTRKSAPLIAFTDMIKKGTIDAVVTANDTKLVMGFANRIDMCTTEFKNPAIIVPIPWIKDDYEEGYSYLLDAGANTRCSPQSLLDFGIMARLYIQHVLNVPQPTLSLVNIGEEKRKGSPLELEAYPLLQKHFGEYFREKNAEPERIFSGHADIYVTDGFTGNIVLKEGETLVRKLFKKVKKGIKKEKSLWKRIKRRIGAYFMKDLFYELKATFDPASYGGAPLLGLDTCLIKCHGKSNATAFYNAIKNAARYVRADVTTKMKEEFALARKGYEE